LIFLGVQVVLFHKVGGEIKFGFRF